MRSISSRIALVVAGSAAALGSIIAAPAMASSFSGAASSASGAVFASGAVTLGEVPGTYTLQDDNGWS
ncbi:MULTISPECIES: hypothetical protein [Streptomyces]|uniref:Uncharacterized protein n=1 Tax=Streptomyces chilikensis TaxID=1194079 RepID=A0ABV3EVS0_9ACTN|nr:MULTISPECIES: hypothetical protein [Streptomyces]MDH6226742.1 hypothetical protein [Streptomyces sp. MJP52]